MSTRAKDDSTIAETNLVLLKLRWTGSSLLFTVELVPDGPQAFSLNGIQFQRIRFERDALMALERAGIGHWSEFPADHIQATVTREQLRALGFRGIY